MSFRVPKIILRESQGAYVNGVYTAGTRSVITINASVQPIFFGGQSGQDMESMLDGRRLSQTVKIYTDQLLYYLKESQNYQPDILVQGEHGYELVSISQNQSGVISHYKYIGNKIFRFTSESDWINGVLKRGAA